MNKQRCAAHGLAKLTLAVMALLPLTASAQVPVDEDGKVIGAYEPALDNTNEDLATGYDDIPLMSAIDLEELVGPVALYPDDLLAIILPASAYPQQIIDAARFLDDLEGNPSLKPNPEWDDSVVALLNYPEVIELMSDDIDWTWRLGEAVIAQQQDVLSAIETFRDRAYNAGNLKSDKYQNVARNDGHIEITPVAEDVIYVPYYEPERVVVYQPRPVYYYYPRSYPLYYYPYTSAYDFNRGYFWGVTTAFSIGWFSDSLHVYHHSYHGHPYYGHRYWDRWWYRRPTMNHYHNNYIGNSRVTVNNYYNGDRWRPRRDRRDYVRQEVRRDVRAANNRYIASRREQRQESEQRRSAERHARTQTVSRQEPVSFRNRPQDFQVRTQDQRSRAQARTNRSQEQRAEQRSNTREQRSDGVTRQNRDNVVNQREQRGQTQQRRELVAQQRRAPARTSVQPGREPAAQQRRAPARTSVQTRREPAAQQRRAPARASVQTRREPVPRVSQQRREQRATPQRQQRSAPPPQQRSAPPPQQRSAPPPQRQERSESKSNQKKSESRRGERRERR